ncbi:hypothetical protein ACOESC_001029 [Salmonella enterica]
MNTEITIKNVQILRTGYHTRGFVSANTLLSIPKNIASKNAVVKYLGARIGRIDNLYHSDLRDGRIDLHCDITFTNNFFMLAGMVKNKALYPVCVINTHENEARLSEIFFANEEDREFDEQKPINLSHLLDLVNNIAESEAPAKPLYFRKKHKNLLMMEDKKNNKRYEGAFIKITSKKRPGDSAFFRLDELNAIKPTGMRNIATLLCVSNVNLYPCIHYVDFLSFIAEVQRQEGKAKRGEHRVYTLNIDNKKPLNGKR